MAKNTNKQKPVFHLVPKPHVLKMLQQGAREMKTVQIQYVNQKGEISVRETEPYEIKDGKYWGFCLEKGSIRQFNLERIMDAQVTQYQFRPRWPVKII